MRDQRVPVRWKTYLGAILALGAMGDVGLAADMPAPKELPAAAAAASVPVDFAFGAPAVGL